jgi:hypothetical protein
MKMRRGHFANVCPAFWQVEGGPRAFLRLFSMLQLKVILVPLRGAMAPCSDVLTLPHPSPFSHLSILPPHCLFQFRTEDPTRGLPAEKMNPAFSGFFQN